MCDSKWESVLHSRILVNYFKQLCDYFLPPYKETNPWINRRKAKCNKNLINFLNQFRNLMEDDKVDVETFTDEIKKFKKIKVEILWYLEFFKLMTITEFIRHHENDENGEVVKQIAGQIFESILDYKPNRSEIRKTIMMCYFKTILECSEPRSVFFQELLTFIGGNLKEFYSYDDLVERHIQISNLTELFDQLKSEYDSVKLFFQQILKRLLEGSPQSMKSIIRKQESIKNNMNDKKICVFFKTMANYCDVTFMAEELQTVLMETKGIDWDNMFVFITFIGTHYKDGWSSIKTLINSFVKMSFQNQNEMLLLYAFLLARQGCFEKCNNLFPSYLHWFGLTFSSESKRPIDSKKVCSFFFSFMSELVPYEKTYYLKVHINKVPWVPSDCLLILHEYTDLVKAQLTDLNVSVELGMFENTTNKSAAVHDVENVLMHFERTNNILNSVFQASMFWKDYYEKKFLVELLSKFEGRKSVRHKLILKLHSLRKVPNAMFKVYKSLDKKTK